MQTQEEKINRLKIKIGQTYGIATERFTQEDWVREALKLDWLSNYEAQALVKSSSGDRYIRFIHADLPEGYRLIERVKDCPTYCLEYHLTKDAQLKLFEV